nr:YheC/YheD family protein [Bacilli bacterium]
MRKKGDAIGIMAHIMMRDGHLLGMQAQALYKYFSVAAHHHITLLLFDPIDVDLATQTIEGYTAIAKDEIEQQEDQVLRDPAFTLTRIRCAIPYVIYDQIVSRRYEQSLKIKKQIAFLRQKSIIFNDGYFDKWEVYTWLSKSSRLVSYLPQTIVADSSQAFMAFIDRFPIVFLKPIDGSHGSGIIKIEKSGEQFIVYQHRQQKNLMKVKFTSSLLLYRKLRRQLLRRRYILQEGIPLIMLDHRPVDVRVLMQKNRQGVWKMTKLYVRKAKEGEYTSNLARGGEAVPLLTLQGTLLPVSLATVKAQIKKVSYWIAMTIENEAKRTIGELGVDLGIARDGRIAIIEVNAKPWKRPQTIHGSHQLVEIAFARPICYAEALLWQEVRPL